MVLISPDVGERAELFQRFGELFERAKLVESGEQVAQRLLEREAILSTGIGGGVAVPHAQIPGLGRLVMAASTHANGLQYPALDKQPVQLVCWEMPKPRRTTSRVLPAWPASRGAARR